MWRVLTFSREAAALDGSSRRDSEEEIAGFSGWVEINLEETLHPLMVNSMKINIKWFKEDL